MPDFDLLAIPLLSGYFYIMHSNLTKFRIARDNGQSILFKSGFFGLIFYAVGYIMWVVWDEFFWGETLFNLSIFLNGNYFAVPAFLSFFIGMISLVITNLITDEKKKKISVVRQDDDAIETIILDAALFKKSVQITLKNGKVYTGKITDTFFRVNDVITGLRISPISSGYRTVPEHKIKFTTRYDEIYKKIIKIRNDKIKDSKLSKVKISDFEVSIKYSELLSITFWHEDWFEVFKESQKLEKTESGKASN